MAYLETLVRVADWRSIGRDGQPWPASPGYVPRPGFSGSAEPQ